MWAGIQETGNKGIGHSTILHIYQLFPVFVLMQMKWLPEMSLFILFRQEFSQSNPFNPSWKQIPRFFFFPNWFMSLVRRYGVQRMLLLSEKEFIAQTKKKNPLI